MKGSPPPDTVEQEEEEFLTDQEAEERDDLDGQIDRPDIDVDEADDAGADDREEE